MTLTHNGRVYHVEADTLLGKRFDFHDDGRVLDLRISALDPGRNIATVHVLVPGQRRQRQHVALTDVIEGIQQGVLLENDRP